MKFWKCCGGILVCVIACPLIVWATWAPCWELNLYPLPFILGALPLLFAKKIYRRGNADPFDIE